MDIKDLKAEIAQRARAARQRLRYETWYYLHFYTLLSIKTHSGQFIPHADECEVGP